MLKPINNVPLDYSLCQDTVTVYHREGLTRQVLDGVCYEFTTHRQVDGGIARVSRNLALPMGAANAAYASAGGLGVRVVYDYDSATKTDKISFDVIYGIRELEPSLICKLKG